MTAYFPSVSDSSNTWTDANETDYIEVIETVISSMETEATAMVSHTEDGHFWKFTYGTVEVRVKLSGLTPDDTLTAWATVLSLPAKNEPQLLRSLLEKNWTDTFEARFGILDNEIVVLSSRILSDVSPGEISRLLTIVATLADEMDEPLQAEYGQG